VAAARLDDRLEEPLWSIEMREAMSCVSSVDGGVILSLFDESSDRVEADGESTWVGSGEGDLGAVEEGLPGVRPLPLPRIRPPPRVRRDMADYATAHMELRGV
jgi:hypothetical protein